MHGSNGNGFDFRAGSDQPGPGPLDWEELRQRILATLGPAGVCQEYERIGVRFSETLAAAPGWRACHSVLRKDEHASAAIHTGTGYYLDQGSNEAGSLWDMLARYGAASDWFHALKLTAGSAGVPWPGSQIRKRNDGRYLTATYNYRDQHGVERYKVERLTRADGSKTFQQSAALGEGKYRTGRGCMDNVPALPYRLPELLADPSAVVYVCEGEKDCDRLASLGLIATTNHGGCQNTARWHDFAVWFRGRTVCIIPDNDPPGFKHALGVADYLRDIAAMVCIKCLPNLPLKGDASDWLDRGHSISELVALDGLSTDEFRQSLSDGEMSGEELDGEDADATAADLIRLGNTTTWLWKNWLPNGVLALLAAEASAGKTSVCLDLTRRIALGLPWPDGTPSTGQPGKVLWIPADSQHPQLADATQTLGFDPEMLVLNASRRDPTAGTDLMTAQHYDELEQRIIRNRPALVVIDTITNVSEYEVNSASDMTKLYKPLADIARTTNTTILCVTHSNADGKTLGRRADEKTRVTITLTQPDKQDERKRLEVTKLRVGKKPEPLGVTWNGTMIEWDKNPPVAPEEDQPRRKRRNNVSSPRLVECVTWLATYLEAGPSRVHHTRRDAEAANFNAALLYRARDSGPFEEFEIEGKKWWRRTDMNTDGASVTREGAF